MMYPILLSFSALTGAVAAPEPPNLIPNPSFEQEAAGRPRSWRTDRWSGNAVWEHARIARTGQRSVMIRSEDGADVAWACNVPVEPFARYRLAGWIKTENVRAVGGRGALLNVHGLRAAATKAVTGTTDWTLVEVTFETEDQDGIQVNCLFGGWGRAAGTAWYDDIVLQQIGRPQPPAKPSIAIDASKEGQPVSRYVYGQFIEHLGRCIYGGIWAEMLEDRKFFHPVGGKESPWKPVGDQQAVRMSRENPFVGEHTPVIDLPGGQRRGIAQSGLALVRGKSYEGRIWLAGSPEAAPVTVSLVWGPGDADRQSVVIQQVTETFARSPLRFTAPVDAPDATLEITSSGKGTLRIGTLSLMPADNVNGMRADTIALLRELDAPVYRWPGGNFVSGYNWKDGIGDRDRRPPRKNPAWRGVEHNDFGIDEFIAFCRALGAEPYIAVNSGLGDVNSAREELEYANGPADSPMGKLRAANGHPEPYKVVFWGIGNEMYGNWQLGHMPLEKYIEKHNQFAEAFRRADPAVKLVAVGNVGPWSEGMMKNCANHMDLISEHFYCGERPGLLGHVRQIPASVRRIAEAHRRYRQQFESLKGKDIRIALDEWNYWYGPHLFGELGTRYFLKDALGIAAGIHEMARNSDMYFMANYAQTVNVIGCIKTSKTSAAFETTGLVLKLYRQRFGTIPLETKTTGFIDAMAALSADRKTLTIGVVNPTMEQQEVPLSIAGLKPAGDGVRYQIAGTDPQAYNDPDQPPKVNIEEARITGVADKLTVAPCSVTLVVLQL